MLLIIGKVSGLKYMLSFIILLLLIASSAWAQDFDKGMEAYDRGDYDGAFQEFRPLAKQGHALAQFRLGTMYAQGLGVPLDYEKAAMLYRESAERQVVGAQFLLGISYYHGKGVPQDHGEAAKWFRKAARQGLPDSQFSIGNMYAHGKGVSQDHIKAHKWFCSTTIISPCQRQL